MTSRPVRWVLLCSLVLALVGGAGGVPVVAAQPARAASAASAAAGATSVEWGPTTWVGGVGGYSITGRLGGPSRKVRLEYKVAGGWRTLDSTRSRKRTFSLAGPWEWYGAHQVRLRADEAKGRAAKVLGKQTFTVTPEYTPRGLASEFVPMSFQDRIYRFNPCQTIRWRFNSGSGAGDPLFAQTQTALTLLSRATGIRFTYVGTSGAVPLNDKKFEKRTDLVVAFAHDADLPTMDGATARGGSVKLAPAKGAGPRSFEIVRAGVTVSIEKIFNPGSYTQQEVSSTPTTILVLMHELGHAMGLEHVTTPGADVEVMWSAATYMAPWSDGQFYPRWGAGDLAGLAQAGLASGCLR